MDVVTGAMGTLLPKLADLIKEEYKLQKSVRGEIAFLKTELEYMEAALFRVSNAPIDEPADRLYKLWARDVRELSYDLEDTVDTFMVHIVGNHAPTEAKTPSFRAFIERTKNLLSTGKIRHNIGADIEEYRRRLNEVKERRDRYKVDNIPAKPLDPSSVYSLRQVALYKEATHLIGTEESANELIKMLTEEEDHRSSNKKLKIVSIVGVGGLGKTTLANRVYQMLKENYDCGALVTVSTNPNMDIIFKKMLEKLDEDKYRGINGEVWDQSQLIDELREFLRKKRYIIVIDDIWHKSAWRIIRHSLINNELGSRIITTTRNLDVAIQTGGSVYELKPLSHDDSRRLFYLTILGTKDGCLPKELDKQSENILRKCGGVPLAIITIGSMLASNKERTCEYWSKVYKSMGSGLQNSSDDVNNMRSILSVSYYDLPPHLRTCLLYLSLYPEDSEIHTQDLIWKWICEGFVKDRGKGIFEVGEDYVYELINRSLIQPLFIDAYSKKIHYFRIHDMVLDLIISLSNEEHFLTKLGAQEPESLPNKIRRLSVNFCKEENERQLGKKNWSHVRSLIVFSGAFNLLPELSSFPVLRVLDLTRAKVDNHHCRDICNLLHLRYLALPESITEIPQEIGRLMFLQVLDINKTTVVKLPPSFVQLRQLVCLRLKALETIPDWFGNLKSLQELIGYIHLESLTSLHVLGGLNELRRIHLCFDEWDENYVQPFLSWLSSMVRLKDLTIDGTGDVDIGSRCDKLSPGPRQLQEIVTHRAISSVPRWMSSLCSLSVLRISMQKLGKEDLQILGSMPSLSELSIGVNEPTQSSAKELLVIGNNYPFLCLTKFEFCNNIEVMFAQGAMQKLQALRFQVQETMDQFGDSGFGLENLSSLEHVFVYLIVSHANPEEIETAENAIQKAVNMIPNKPKLEIEKWFELKLGIEFGEESNNAMDIVSRINGVHGVSLDPRNEGCLMMQVKGTVDRTTIMEKLKQAGIPAELSSHRRMLPTPSGSAIMETATATDGASSN